jgi:NADP-dependent 3-hydroxy acid dehydrogenase YdfG
MRDVEGKVAFITGGGSGVGIGMAKVFHAAGMKVAIADIRDDHLDEATASSAATSSRFALDVTDREAFARAPTRRTRSRERARPLQQRRHQPFNDIAEATVPGLDWVLGVNSAASINGVVTFVPRIKAHGERGHVVNTASMAAFVAGPGAGIYTTAKFAVHGLSDDAALEPAAATGSASPWSARPGQEQDLRERPDPAGRAVDRHDPGRPRVHADPPGLHEAGMDPDEIGEKVLGAIRNNDFYVFTHPRPPRRAARDLRRDDRRVPRRAGAAGAARGRGRPACGEGAGARLLARRLTVQKSRARPPSSRAARAGSGSGWGRRSPAPG